MKKISMFFGILLLILLVSSSPAYAQTESIDVTGSNTVFPIIQAAAAEWSNSSNGVPITASGPGSGAGITALINGQTDLAPMSRAPRDAEITEAEDEGLDLNITIVALDALVVIVNPNNPIVSMSAETIQGIFNGTIRNWSELGWDGSLDDQIKVVERDENSGTHDFFNEFFLEGEEVPAEDLGDYHSQFTSTLNLFQTIADEENAIGYGGLGYVGDSVSVLKVNDVEATTENAGDGSYPVSRPLYTVFDNNNVKDSVLSFVDFLLSDRGQEIAEEEGYLGAGSKAGYYDKEGLSSVLAEIDQSISDAFEYSGDSVILDTNAAENDTAPITTASFFFGFATVAVIGLIRRRSY